MTVDIINALLSAAIQVAIVLIIALALYPITGGRKEGSFPKYLGLTAPRPLTLLWGAGLGALAAFIILGLPGMKNMAAGENTVAGQIAGNSAGVAALLIFIKAVLTTSLSEEIFFRGLIGKRLIAWLGFSAGNALQAAIFGAVHFIILLSPEATMTTAVMLVGFTAVFGWISGYLNERLGNGSIAPSWLMHAVANIIAYSLIAFG